MEMEEITEAYNKENTTESIYLVLFIFIKPVVNE